MRLRTRLAAAAGLAVLFTQRSSMSSQSTALTVSVTVVRSCSIRQPADHRSGVGVSCTRGATPGVMVSSSTAVVPVPPGQTVSLETPADVRDGGLQMMVLNF